MPIAERVNGDNVLRAMHRVVYMVAPALGGFVVFLLWPPEPLRWRVRGGLLWGLIAAGPVLFISPVEVTHNLYLAALGLGLAFGVFWQHVAAFVRDSGWLRPTLLHAYGMAAILLSLTVNQQLFQEFNWRPNWERVARRWVTDVKQMLPGLKPPMQVFVIKSNEADQWSLYGGDVLRVFLKQPGLRFLFDDDGGVFPLEAARRGEAVALTMLDDHVRDVTAGRILDAERNALPRPSLLKQFDRARVSLVSGRAVEFNPSGTPTGSPAFVNAVLMGPDYRPALITLAGTRVRFGVLVTDVGTLSFGLAKRFETGDGVVARVFFEHGGQKQLLFERRLNPRDVPEDRRWLDVTLDLSAYKGQDGTLELECTAGPAGDAVADWLGWSGLFLEGARPL
jgi:hypothetical protein